MRAELSFRVVEPGLEIGELARLLLDLQHLAILAVALGRSSPDQNAVDWSRQSYHWMVEASRREIGEATATVTRFDIGTPLRLGITFPQVPPELEEQTARALRALLERLQLIDLERGAHRLDEMEEASRRRHLDNLADALDLASRFQDTRQRSALLRSLEAGLRPFERHPGMTDATVFAD